MQSSRRRTGALLLRILMFQSSAEARQAHESATDRRRQKHTRPVTVGHLHVHACIMQVSHSWAPTCACMHHAVYSTFMHTPVSWSSGPASSCGRKRRKYRQQLHSGLVLGPHMSAHPLADHSLCLLVDHHTLKLALFYQRFV